MVITSQSRKDVDAQQRLISAALSIFTIRLSFNQKGIFLYYYFYFLLPFCVHKKYQNSLFVGPCLSEFCYFYFAFFTALEVLASLITFSSWSPEICSCHSALILFFFVVFALLLATLASCCHFAAACPNQQSAIQHHHTTAHGQTN